MINKQDSNIASSVGQYVRFIKDMENNITITPQVLVNCTRAKKFLKFFDDYGEAAQSVGNRAKYLTEVKMNNTSLTLQFFRWMLRDDAFKQPKLVADLIRLNE